MKNKTQGNPFGLAAPVDNKEPLRRLIFRRDYREREERRNYLLRIIAQQQAEAPARNAHALLL